MNRFARARGPDNVIHSIVSTSHKPNEIELMARCGAVFVSRSKRIRVCGAPTCIECIVQELHIDRFPRERWDA